MFDDYLNEVLFWFGRRNRRNNTYIKARQLKKQGDAYIFNLLCTEWASRFKWNYDPEDGRKTIACEKIERTILMGDACGFGKLIQKNGTYADESWRNFRVTGMNNLSFYGYPASCTFTDYSGRVIGKYIPAQQQEDDNFANAALIYDNPNGWSPLSIIFYYTEKLSKINTSIHACIGNILGTSIISTSRENGREIVKQREAADIGIPYVLYYDDAEPGRQETKLMTTPGASDELKTLYEAWDKTHGDFLQCIGIRVNSEMNKKAGVTPMEIIENRMNVDILLNNCYESRLRGIEMCEKIGLKGLSVTLDNFESLISDYDKNGNRISNVDPVASDYPAGGETDDDSMEI